MFEKFGPFSELFRAVGCIELGLFCDWSFSDGSFRDPSLHDRMHIPVGPLASTTSGS